MREPQSKMTPSPKNEALPKKYPVDIDTEQADFTQSPSPVEPSRDGRPEFWDAIEIEAGKTNPVPGWATPASNHIRNLQAYAVSLETEMDRRAKACDLYQSKVEAELAALKGELALVRESEWNQTDVASEAERKLVEAQLEIDALKASKGVDVGKVREVLDKIDEINLAGGMCYSDKLYNAVEELKSLLTAEPSEPKLTDHTDDKERQ